MTNFQFPMAERAAPCQVIGGVPSSLLVIGHWQLIIPAIVRERVRE
jgi:hypothetical protein